MIGLFWAFGTIFLICEFGERFTTRCESIEEAFYHWYWYLFPMEIQKLLVLAIASAQHTFIIKGYGNIPCTRSTFKSVNRNQFNISFHFNKFHFVLLLDGENMPFIFYGAPPNRWIGKKEHQMFCRDHQVNSGWKNATSLLQCSRCLLVWHPFAPAKSTCIAVVKSRFLMKSIMDSLCVHSRAYLHCSTL